MDHNVVLQNRVYILDVLIIPSSPVSLILGADFIRGLGVVPDLRSDAWYFSKHNKHSRPTILMVGIQDRNTLTAAQQKALNELVAKKLTDISDRVLEKAKVRDYKIKLLLLLQF